MTPAFGEFLRPASGHIAAAVSYPELPDQARGGVIRQLDRIVTALAHYLADIAPEREPGTVPAGQLDSQARAAIEARTALRRAAQSLRHGAMTVDDAAAGCTHPAVAHLAAAADNLGAGRDVLQTHFARGPFGYWEGNSYWAPVITSRPLTAALMSELAGHARTLAPWAARQSVSGPMDTGPPPAASLALHTATRWLWVAGATIEAALRHHPPTQQERRLLAAVPANFPPPRLPPAAGEDLLELCNGITISAERLRRAALASTSHAHWSAAATSTVWRKNALASAITGHASQLILQTLTERASQLGLGAAIQARLRTASQDVQDAWTAWRAIAGEWDILSTGRHRDQHPTPAGLEFGDLALRMTRLASSDPQRACPSAGDGRSREPSLLAAGAKDVSTVLSTVHHAIDAITRAGAEDQHAVRTAVADKGLYIPTRLMPDTADIPRPYAPAPSARTQTLLGSYDTAIAASTRAATTLDALAAKLGAPSWPLTALRTPIRPVTRGLHLSEPVLVQRPASQPSRPSPNATPTTAGV